METKSYLTFHLRNIWYGIDVSTVKEIFLLPELIPLADAPIDIMGVLNFRGRIIPVMHLDLRLGNPIQECKISDSVIVIEWEKLQIAIVVDEVHQVENIDAKLVEKEISYGRVRNINPAFIAGVAQVDNDAIVLLNTEALIREPDAVETLFQETNQEDVIDAVETGQKVTLSTSSIAARLISNFYDVYCPNATIQERAIFRQRADNLKQSDFEDELESLEQIPVAVIGLGGEYFGIDLDTVREFINIRDFTQIPCCPNHIIGNMNLRGEVVTLVDIRGTLNLSTTSVKVGSKAVVIGVDDIVAGLPVDDVFDVMYLSSSDLNPVPIAIDSSNNNYLRGTALYCEKTMSVLDLSKLLNKSGLVVNEEV